MKKVLFLIIIICFIYASNAQKVYFIYLQSENNAPFFVKMSDKIHSSSPSGYLILSNLKDSTYNFSVGFPGNKSQEARFSVSTDNIDKGFLIKEFDGTPGLFDLQTMVINRAITTNTNNEQTTTKNDSFTRLLSQAAKDESILTTPVVTKAAPVKPQQEKPQPQPVENNNESTSVSTMPPVTGVPKEEPVVKEVEVSKPAPVEQKVEEKPIEQKVEEKSIVQKVEEKPIEPAKIEEKENQKEVMVEYKRSNVTRRSESSTTEGFGLVFLDVQENSTDTIRLLIPNPKTPVRSETFETVNDAQQAIVKTETISSKNSPAPVVRTDNRSKANSCKSSASDNDFRKLRKNMAGEDNDEDMIEEAKKVFRSKCFTVEQIRNLSTLFLTAASKYQFFDAAYTHVVDKNMFPELQSEIRDEYYSKRFNALVGE